MSARRTLPIYGGFDEGPRPQARDQVADALAGGVDLLVVAERVAAHVDAIVARHAVAELPGEPRPACARGCSHCCHARVEATAPEIFLVARALRARGDPSVADGVAATAARLEGMEGRAHQRAQVRCALLGDDGACTVYAARPIGCRRAHSTDAAICKAVHEDPTLDVSVPFAPALQWTASALVLGWMEGCAHAGRPPHHYELHAALTIALRDADAEARFARGDDPLRSARTRAAEDLPSVLGSAGS